MNALLHRAALALAAVCALALAGCGGGDTDEAAGGADAEPRAVNLYTARHYASDEAVYAAFTEATGIAVNVVEADGDLLIERVRTEGARSPADVIITVDAGRLHRAEEAGLFQPAGDLGGALEGVPENLRHPEGLWFGFASRARVIAYAQDRVDPAEIETYQDLAEPAFAGRVCVRSSDNVYNQSLLAALIAREGEAAALAWAEGIADNLARAPRGGDTDQLRVIAAGACDVAIVNHYYWARLARSEDPADQAVAAATGLVFPNQSAGGTHVNISGAGLAADAPNPEAARTFLAFLLSEPGQRAFAELTNEFPAVEDAAYENLVLTALEGFEADRVNVTVFGENAEAAVRIFDQAGWP